MNSYHTVDPDYAAYLHHTASQRPPLSKLVCAGPSQSYSRDFYDYSHDLGQFSEPDSNFVSPVIYDPASGIYTQTFPEEYMDFLRKFGQHVHIPNPSDSQPGEWSFNDIQTSIPLSEQPCGFYYNTGNYSEPHDVAMFSPVSDDDADTMMQYIVSPTPAPSQVQHTNHVATPALSYAATPDLSQHVAYTPPAPIQEELMQPHMIVPSQQPLTGYIEELRRRELPVMVPMHQPSTPPKKNRSPFKGLSASPSLVVVSPQVPPQTPEQKWHEHTWAIPMKGQTTGHPAHDLHPVAPEPEVASPAVSSSDSDDSYVASRSPSHSPKAKNRAASRGRSSHRRSPSPSAPSLGIRLSPLPHNRKIATTDADKKLTLACLFCRGRKIACGPPLPGSTDKSCNQCARRRLVCEYPTESRRGMRKRNRNSKGTKTTVKGARKRATR